MGLITIPAGETKKIADGSNYDNVDLTIKNSTVRLSGRQRLAESGKEVPVPADVSLELEAGEDLFAYNNGESTAKIEVTDQ